MRNPYKDEDIERFFEQFKKRTSTYPLDSIVQLIDHQPLNTSAGFKFFKSFKIPILMIAITALIITSYFLFMNNPVHTFNEESKLEDELDTENILTLKDSFDISSFDQKEIDEKRDFMPKDQIPTITYEQNRNEGQNAADNHQDSVELPKVNSLVPEGKKEMADESYCNWPEDTVFDGNSFVLDLTIDELRDIGFLINETGIYYANEYQGKEVYFHSRFENLSGEITILNDQRHSNNKKLKISHNNFFPVYITDFLFNPIAVSISDYEKFDYANDTLIPIRLKRKILKIGQYDRIIWFQPTEELFNKLSERFERLKDDYDCIKQLKLAGNKRNIVQYLRKSIIEGSRPISVSKHILEKIGLKFNSDFSVTYREFNEGCGFAIRIKKDMQGVSMLPDNRANEISNFHLLMVSDDHGKQNIQWRCEDDQYLNLHKEHDLLVPIIMKQDNFPQYISKNMIFWFEPSSKLFNALPREIGKQLKKEYDYIMADEEERKDMDTSCTYFEACRSTLKLPEFKLYPNPVVDLLNLSFYIHKQASGSVSLLSIDGYQMKELRKTSAFPAGANKYAFNVSDMSDGIYILRVETNQGFLTRRIIIQK